MAFRSRPRSSPGGGQRHGNGDSRRASQIRPRTSTSRPDTGLKSRGGNDSSVTSPLYFIESPEGSSWDQRRKKFLPPFDGPFHDAKFPLRAQSHYKKRSLTRPKTSSGVSSRHSPTNYLKARQYQRQQRRKPTSAGRYTSSRSSGTNITARMRPYSSYSSPTRSQQQEEQQEEEEERNFNLAKLAQHHRASHARKEHQIARKKAALDKKTKTYRPGQRDEIDINPYSPVLLAYGSSSGNTGKRGSVEDEGTQRREMNDGRILTKIAQSKLFEETVAVQRARAFGSDTNNITLDKKASSMPVMFEAILSKAQEFSSKRDIFETIPTACAVEAIEYALCSSFNPKFAMRIRKILLSNLYLGGEEAIWSNALQFYALNQQIPSSSIYNRSKLYRERCHELASQLHTIKALMHQVPDSEATKQILDIINFGVGGSGGGENVASGPHQSPQVSEN